LDTKYGTAEADALPLIGAVKESMNVRDILCQSRREWNAKPPASEIEIALLESRARAKLPPEYLDLLRFSNGGEGPLNLPPLWFQLYAVNDCIELCHGDGWVLKEFPNFIFFGSNGGLESIAFDLRIGPPWPIVMIDQIAGPESAKEVAPNMATFVEAIGLESAE
jgi:SMI1 / KNR4 family (SUKH-1)